MDGWVDNIKTDCKEGEYENVMLIKKAEDRTE
jgi:hypothetical protein